MIDIEISEEAVGNNPAARSALFDDDDADELQRIQNLRVQLSKKLTMDEVGGLKIPEKTADKVLLAQLLDGSERLIMTKARLKVASKTTDELGNLADAVAKALKGFKPSTHTALPMEREIPGEFLRIDTVPGEMDIGNIPMTIDQLQKTEVI